MFSLAFPPTSQETHVTRSAPHAAGRKRTERANCLDSSAIRKPPRPPSNYTSPFIIFNMLVPWSPSYSRRRSHISQSLGGILTLGTARTRCRGHCRMPGRKDFPVQGPGHGQQGLCRGQKAPTPAGLYGYVPWSDRYTQTNYLKVLAMFDIQPWERHLRTCCTYDHTL
jgi:hypothetical protein